MEKCSYFTSKYLSKHVCSSNVKLNQAKEVPSWSFWNGGSAELLSWFYSNGKQPGQYWEVFLLWPGLTRVTDALERPAAALTHPQVMDPLTWVHMEFQSVQYSSTETLLFSECPQAQPSKMISTASSESNKPATNEHQTLVYRRQTSPMASTRVCQQINSNSSYKCDPAHSSQIYCYLEPFKPHIGCWKQHLWFNPSGQLRSPTVKWEKLLTEIQTI